MMQQSIYTKKIAVIASEAKQSAAFLDHFVVDPLLERLLRFARNDEFGTKAQVYEVK